MGRWKREDGWRLGECRMYVARSNLEINRCGVEVKLDCDSLLNLVWNRHCYYTPTPTRHHRRPVLPSPLPPITNTVTPSSVNVSQVRRTSSSTPYNTTTHTHTFLSSPSHYLTFSPQIQCMLCDRSYFSLHCLSFTSCPKRPPSFPLVVIVRLSLSHSISRAYPITLCVNKSLPVTTLLTN